MYVCMCVCMYNKFHSIVDTFLTLDCGKIFVVTGCLNQLNLNPNSCAVNSPKPNMKPCKNGSNKLTQLLPIYCTAS